MKSSTALVRGEERLDPWNIVLPKLRAQRLAKPFTEGHPGSRADIDDESLANDVSGGVGGKIQDCVGNIARLTGDPQNRAPGTILQDRGALRFVDAAANRRFWPYPKTLLNREPIVAERIGRRLRPARSVSPRKQQSNPVVK